MNSMSVTANLQVTRSVQGYLMEQGARKTGRALVYVRKSVVRGIADTVSPERQKAACIAEAQRHGWVVEDGDVYADVVGHSSGKDDTRPGWRALLARMRSDESVKAVVVESLSRASRSVRSFLLFVEELQERGIALVSLSERFDTSTALGQAMLGFIAIINQLESDLAAERMRGQIAFKRRQGRHWGLTPFGCDRERETGALRPSSATYVAPDGTERKYHDSLRRCYELYATGQYSLDEVAEQLNAEGWMFRSRAGEPVYWNRFRVRQAVACCRIYEGFVQLSGAAKGGVEEWVAGNFDPILPPDLCQQVEEVWKRRSAEIRHPPPVWPRELYPLTGVLFCGSCGARMKGAKGRRNRRRQYIHVGHKGACAEPRVYADVVEAEVISCLRKFVVPPDVIGEVVAAVEEGRRRADDLCLRRDALRAELSNLRAQQQRLVQLVLRVGLDDEVHLAETRRLNEAIAKVQRELEEAEAACRAAEFGAQEIVQALNDLSLVAQRMSAELRRDLLYSIFERIEVSGGKVSRVVPRGWCRAAMGAVEKFLEG
jgi:site-specific DNA recombinase